jgi:hypothetical protein
MRCGRVRKLGWAFCCFYLIRAAAAQVESNRRAIDVLLQQFNQALLSHRVSDLQALLTRNTAARDLDCGASTFRVAFDKLAGEPSEVLNEQSPSSIRLRCMRFVGSDVALLDVQRVSFSSGAGVTTMSYTIVISKEEGRWRIAGIRFAGTVRGAELPSNE